MGEISADLKMSTYTFCTGDITVKAAAGSDLKMQVICARKTILPDSAIVVKSIWPLKDSTLLHQQPLRAAAGKAPAEILALPVISELTSILADKVPLLMKHRKTKEKTFNILIDLVYSKEQDQMMKSTSPSDPDSSRSRLFDRMVVPDKPLELEKLCDAMSKGTAGSGLSGDNPVYQLIGKVIGFLVRDLLFGLGNRLKEVMTNENVSGASTKCWKLAYYMLNCLPTELEPRTSGFKLGLALKANVEKIQKYIKSHIDSGLSSGKVSKLITVYKKWVRNFRYNRICMTYL